MSNPMAQSEPVEQRFGAPASNEAEQAPAPTRQIDGTDVVEQGSLSTMLRPSRTSSIPSWASTSSTWASCTAS